MNIGLKLPEADIKRIISLLANAREAAYYDHDPSSDSLYIKYGEILERINEGLLQESDVTNKIKAKRAEIDREYGNPECLGSRTAQCFSQMIILDWVIKELESG